MLQIGVIEPTTSAQYNSPCFLVNKKNNEKRFVLDLRSLNAAIMPELVQLPKVTELIDDVTSKHCKFLSSLDLRAGYWQIPLSKRSRHFASHRLFLTLSPIVYWKELYQDLKNYTVVC